MEADLRPDLRHGLALVLFAFAVPVSGLLWGRVVNTISPDNRVSRVDAVMVHCASWLLKYIPGQIGSVMSKVLWGQRNGLSRSLVLITFVYENVFLQLASIVPSVIILVIAVGPTLLENNVATVALLAVALIPLVAVLIPSVFHRVLDIASRRVLKSPLPEEYFLRPAKSLGFTVAYILPRLINGVGFILITATVTDVDASMWLPLAATYALAGAIGILAVLVPSGLGVREAVIYACFVALGFTPAEAVLVALLSRLLSTLADAVVALLYGGLRLSRRKGPRP